MSREVLDEFARFRRRHARVRALDLFLEAAFVLTMTAAAVLLTDRLAFELGLAEPVFATRRAVPAVFAGALAAAALAAVAWTAMRPARPAALAVRVDRATGGEERFLSALELAVQGASGPFADAVCRDALRVSRAAPAAAVLPAPPVGYRGAVLLALLAGGVLWAVPPAVHPAPTAALDADPLRGPAPLEVRFRDGSIGAIRAFRWSFGDGATAEGEAATHVYERPGRYRATLAVEGPGGSSSASVEIEVLDPGRAVADFEGRPRKGRERVSVRFENKSVNADRVRWDFGDGATSEESDPVHAYEGPGLYTVTLTAANELGEDVRVREKYIKVAHPGEPLADFRALPREGGAPLEVAFEDLSTGIVSERRWDFGDVHAGSQSVSRETNPVHVYRVPGRYTVRLRVKGPHGEDVEEKVRYIHVRQEGDGPGGGGGGRPKPTPRPRPSASLPGGLRNETMERPKVTLVPEAAPYPKPGAELVEKDVRVYAPPPPGTPGAQAPPRPESVLPEYRRAAEDAIDAERVPPWLREAARRYFDLPRR